MVGRRAMVATMAAVVLATAGCGSTVAGTATWPGATLARVALTAADVPAGVQFARIPENPGKPDGAGGPPSMLSRPEGCANALTNVIAQSAERGPGSALKYVVGYNGARILMTVVSWPLDMDKLRAAAQRCAQFEALFDRAGPGIPITTTELPGAPDGVLAYQQTMKLGGASSSVYMAFENVGKLAVFGTAFPTPNPGIPVKASLPQTFLDLFAKQSAKMRVPE
ncbi:hypothetical protein MANY_05560 [Mycolicibacterium anyangense]|uniref:DUF5642 domain-containing protein n=1 Tax=Mycolicibacterium anyangense TaxID=1431246 RepID=A0A6N4W2J7_9MYCO|nr:hypothetical protein [Mycolicibacterium anyangense]BBZ75219.1 hypothetical protein MANY_05560 [Mycolicibacterium anyangense]